jgi:NtrC-family two-component system response regulator AlgB
LGAAHTQQAADEVAPEDGQFFRTLAAIYKKTKVLSPAPATILIPGESGMGKTVLARAIHDRSPQKDNAFVTANCPSLSRELLESELFRHAKGSFTSATGGHVGQSRRG